MNCISNTITVILSVILVLLVILLQCTSAVLCGANSTRGVHNSVMSKLLSRNPPEVWNGITDNHGNDDDDDDDNHYGHEYICKEAPSALLAS